MNEYPNYPNNGQQPMDANPQQPNVPPQYNQPPYPQPAYDPTTQVMSIGQYIGMFILSAIPVVNVICWIVWLCSSNTNKNKKNYIWASIILWVIGVVLIILLSVLGAAMGLDMADAMSSM